MGSGSRKSNEIAVIRFISRVYPIPIRLMIPQHISLYPHSSSFFYGDIYARVMRELRIARACPRCGCSSTSLDWIQFAESFVGFSIACRARLNAPDRRPCCKLTPLLFKLHAFNESESNYRCYRPGNIVSDIYASPTFAFILYSNYSDGISFGQSVRLGEKGCRCCAAVSI